MERHRLGANARRKVLKAFQEALKEKMKIVSILYSKRFMDRRKYQSCKHKIWWFDDKTAWWRARSA